MPNKEEIKELLSDLGRATLRGVRKCPKCGTYNGTRGLSCKNKACDVVFKEAGEKRKFSTDACRLQTGSNTQVFSVRVRDKGPDYRGFVQLLTESDPLSTGGLEAEDGTLISPNAALCFVDTCQRSFDASVLKCHEKNSVVSSLQPVSCQHIAAALRCFAESVPLTLKPTVINLLDCDGNTKQCLWNLIAETSGPLVQRVSKTIMAVKCKPSPKHPLGYLHFAFLTSRVKDRVEHRHFCSCPEFKGGKDDISLLKRCVHFYACVCAFVSDDKLSEEFAHYVEMCYPPSSPNREEHQLFSILNDALEGGADPCEVEVVLQDEPLLQSASISVAEDGTITQVHELGDIQIHPLDSDGMTYSADEIADMLPKISIPHVQSKLKRKREGSVNEALMTLHKPLESSVQALCSSKGRVISGNIRGNGSQKQSVSDRKPMPSTAFKKQDPPDENESNVSFIQWLASVTERINQTMHFQFCGDPDPLVFHVPQVFFDCLRERMSTPLGGNKKRRLPNTTTVFVRKDSVPLGTFTKYTWHITSVLFVKHIFDTPLMPLDIIRSFVENRDGTYDLFHNSNKKEDKNFNLSKTMKRPLIKPLEVRTYLKVGNTSPDQMEPTPFVIEWIPDVLPLSRVGELRLQFKFGHQRCGSEQARSPFIRQPLKTSVKSRASKAKRRQKLTPFSQQQAASISVLVDPEELMSL
ncbi:uncharacterized protein C2orf42 homolog isoform X2 [Frankliniella occidentalis]|uniref:Uncharacterized protein C2orf42 homolog isoform X2 n=1 Tax=Frankliniella occidentalis TaxID=133901 RepID=A0A6J1TKQ4_FRAOC|nr:uncharacterized protein C2orf42 homolog isoform X2 [Frankliniella occidentalis]